MADFTWLFLVLLIDRLDTFIVALLALEMEMYLIKMQHYILVAKIGDSI